MDVDVALSFARSIRRSVLATIRGNGRPQLSNVTHQIDPDGLIRISLTADRAKYRNLLREPWAALHVTSDDFWSWVVIEADVELTDVASDPHDDVVEELIRYYRGAAGEHPDWDDYRRAMVADRRVVARLRAVRAYGLLPEG
jgi:PPOX class probable F420-dependent enzyme